MDFLKSAIKDGADVNGGSGDKARTPLMIASLNDDSLEVVKLLLKHGAKVNETDTHGDTALLLASQSTTNIDIFNTLIEAGADVNVRNRDQTTPLMAAAGGNFKSAVTETLLKAGAKVDDKDMDGRTPLVFAVTYNENPKVTEALIKSGADCNSKNRYGLPVIMMAAQSNFLEYPYLTQKIYQAFSFKEAKKFTIISARILKLVGRYFIVKTVISFFTGLEVYLVLTLLNVDFPLVWGGIAFVLNFVPTVGSSVVVILISIQGTVQFYPNLFMPTLIFLLNLGIQQLMGNFIEPRVQGSNLNLSPVLILISLAFMAWMWGAVGAVLAVPITVMLRVVFGYFDSTRFLSILMSTGYSKKK